MNDLPAESVAPDDPPKEPLLGLATTLDLLNELYVRFEVPTPDTLARETILRLIEDLPDRTLNYRTVDS